MNKMKIKIFTLLSLLITFSLTLSSCDSLWDDLNTLPKYTITYNSNNGTGTMEPQIFEENVPQALRENKFTREGYTFAGWATKADASEAEYADKASFTATKNITLYAIWSVIPPVPSKYTITYNSNNGTGTMEPQIFEENVPQALSENKFTRENYTFAGWATKADASTAEYTDKANYTATKDITLYAIWSVIPPTKYTITYNSNSGSGTMEPQIFEENVPQALSENKFTRENYTFAGWATKADASEAEYADKASFTATKNITLYAIWSLIPPTKYTITYVSAYGSKPANKEVDKGYTLTSSDLPDLGETEDKYFDKWDITVGTEITADTTITAAWDDIIYLTNFSKVTDIKTNKAKIEKIVFTSDTYSGAAATIDCSDTAGYFTGVLTDGTTAGQYILTIYGNGHRIYAPKDCTQLFSNYNVLTTIEFNNFYTSKTTNMSAMFYYSSPNSNALTSLNVSGFITSEVTNMMAMFWNCSKLTSLDVSNFDTSKVTNMANMFTGLTVTKLDLSNFVTTSVNNMKNMFQACTNLTTLNISSFNTSAVTDMSNMFYGCSSLTSLDVSKFDTAKVTTMKQMFADCYGLEELDLSSFDTSEVTDMSLMFSCYNTNKTNLKKIIFSSKFKTDKVKIFEKMFYRCEKLTELDISSFSSSAITNIKEMFSTCSELKTIYASSGFDLSGLTSNNTNVFSGDTKLKGGNDTTCDGTNNIDNAYAHIDEGTSNPGYFTLKQ